MELIIFVNWFLSRELSEIGSCLFCLMSINLHLEYPFEEDRTMREIHAQDAYTNYIFLDSSPPQ